VASYLSRAYTLTGMAPVTLLKEWVYCPRIAYFKANLRLEPPTESMQAPRSMRLAERLPRLLGEAGLHLKWWEQQVPVASRSLRLRGVADLVGEAEGVGVIVAEAKLRLPPRRLALHHIAQAAAYAIAAEETMGLRVERLALAGVEDGRVRVAPLTPSLRRWIHRLAAEMHEALSKPEPPAPTPRRARCRACFYKNLCPPP
jgi:CRISPR-associated exonuclease Cas4